MLLPWKKLLKSRGWSIELSPSSRDWDRGPCQSFLTQEQATEVRFGRFIELDQIDQELAAFEDDKLIAILEKRGNFYKPRKVFS